MIGRSSLIFSLLLVFISLGGWTSAAEAPAADGKTDLLGIESRSASKSFSQIRNEAPAEEIARVQESYGKIPLYFIKNDGQVPKKIKFYEKGSGHATFFANDGVYLSLTRAKEERRPDVRRHENSPEIISKEFETESIKLSLLGAHRAPKITAEDEQTGKINYLVGNDKSKWKTGIATYGSILYSEVYKGVDVRYYGNNSKLEYDVIVKPGADPKQVRFRYEGVKGLSVTEDGDLEIALQGGAIHQKRPYIYQDIDGNRVEVEGSFKVLPAKDGCAYGFEVAAYDKSRELVIDPYIVYSTYLGGSSHDRGYDIAVDSEGSVYITGDTISTNFPDSSATPWGYGINRDAFVTKLSSSGALVYSTYLGGGSYDAGRGIAVDSTGNAYVTGYTNSLGFPVVSPIQSSLKGAVDFFVTKISPNGETLIYSTYLGGSDDDEGYGITVDSADNAYVTGTVCSSRSDFPFFFSIIGSWSNSCNLFVTKISSAGSLVYSTAIGAGYGTSGTGSSLGHSIAVDSTGSAYITGFTGSPGFPVSSALQETHGGQWDAFITKINPSGTLLLYSTYLGGNSYDKGYDIKVDSDGNAYVTGETRSFDFPIASAMQELPAAGTAGGSDAFITKISSTGALVYSRLLGTAYNDGGRGIAVDSNGNAYIAMDTHMDDMDTFPLYFGGPSVIIAGATDAFIAKVNSEGNLMSSSVLGGSANDYVRGIETDSDGNAYVTGFTGSTDFPTSSAMAGANAGYWDAFVAKISFTGPVLSHPSESGYGDGIAPDTGAPSPVFEYKTVYTDADNNAPTYIRACIDGACNPMSLDAGAAAALQDGDYTNGEQFVYSTTLPAGLHNYFFEASDGIDTARLPSTGVLNGPAVSDLAVTTSALPDGTVGVAYGETLAAVGGTAPYAWSTSGGLPPGLTLSSGGTVSGIPAVDGIYGFTVAVTDSTSFVSSRTLSITINPGDTTPPTGSVSINGGAASTNSTVATLALSCVDTGSGCSQMRFSNDGSSWSAWESFATVRSWTLDPGDGVKTVYAEYMDGAGNSAQGSDTIILDATAPAVSASPTGGSYASAQSVTLTADEPSTIYYTTDGSIPTTGSAAYSGPITVSSSAVLKFFAADLAGNESGVMSETYMLNRPPQMDAGGDRTVYEGEHLYFVVSASDADGDVVTFRATGLPSGAVLDASSGAISYTPGHDVCSQSANAYFDVFFEADDGKGGIASETVRITVLDRNRAPIAQAGADLHMSCGSIGGTTVTLDGSGSNDPDGDGLTYTWSGPFQEGGGIVTGISPIVTLPAGRSAVSLVVNDGKADSASDAVNIAILLEIQGFSSPLGALSNEGTPIQPPDKAFKKGSTLPLKIQLSCNGNALTSNEVVSPRIVSLSRGSDVSDPEVIDLDSGQANDDGTNFRYSDYEWVYNLSTKALNTGSYIITVEMPDGSRYNGSFGLK
ncbi:MAG: SBBP repeat-containing protein [Deltaproteobacteria bacterium]|nr:SBBP repeat-containing protein [Deltaproteobacteria bacterium]MBZ0219873.1 SBBP repeat-containing protein [Deltaproteobacteria bacterium]